MNNYQALIDGGEGGEETFEAESAEEALIEAIEWAREGDWGDGGCDILVRVTNEADEDDTLDETVHIPTKEEEKDKELDEDGEVLAEKEHEFSTEKIVVLAGDAYYVHENGGARGAYSNQDGDGVWRYKPVDQTRILSRQEVICLLLDWGREPAKVARLIKHLD